MSLMLYPLYIQLLTYIKAGKQIRDDDVTGNKASIFKKLHGHKAGTPTMGGGLILIIIAILVGASFLVQELGFTRNSLLARQETYILLFAIFNFKGT